MNKFLSAKKLNNRGAALVLVIVVIAFVSVTATVLLYMSAMNFYMKTTDTKTKKSFYSGEKAIEEIKASLMITATEAFEASYYKVMADYGSSDASSMQAKLNQEFIDSFEKIWYAKVVAGGTTYPSDTDLSTYLNSIVDSTYSSSVSVSGSNGIKNVSAGTFTITNVSLEYTDANGYLTKITTDFQITVPKIRFDLGSSATEDIDLVNFVDYINWVKM